MTERRYKSFDRPTRGQLLAGLLEAGFALHEHEPMLRSPYTEEVHTYIVRDAANDDEATISVFLHVIDVHPFTTPIVQFFDLDAHELEQAPDQVDKLVANLPRVTGVIDCLDASLLCSHHGEILAADRLRNIIREYPSANLRQTVEQAKMLRETREVEAAERRAWDANP